MVVKKMTPMISHLKIEKEVKKSARLITESFRGKHPILIGILNAAFVFLADLSRRIRIDHEIDFISCSSYEKGIQQANKVSLLHCADASRIRDRHVILVDTIIDSGKTMALALDTIFSMNPESISVVCLIDKMPMAREKDLLMLPPWNYRSFILHHSAFVVGYGLDFSGFFRNLSDIYDVDSGIPKSKLSPIVEFCSEFKEVIE